ncbi:MAG: aspartate 1-decarboxylase [Nitrospirota bacterium]
MFRLMLKSKIHRVTITDANLEYEGSITIDESILERAGIIPYEHVAISNLNNGERFETYVIPGKRDSGIIALNGPAARKGVTGDKIVIFSYVYCKEEELTGYKPTIINVDERNRVV